ncbi:MAG: hypothetical protein ABJN05_17345 [Sulfitobacter dubius]
MIKHALPFSALLSIAACGTPFNFYEKPSAWTPETRAQFAQQTPAKRCALLLNTTRAAGADHAYIFSEIKKLWLNSRDIESLRDPKNIYGTGMTYLGLECAGGGKLYPNTVFYPGVGHRWQVPFGSGFVYLEGIELKPGCESPPGIEQRTRLETGV